MKSSAFILFFALGSIQISAQSYGWVDISSNIPDFPFDTTVINDGADTIIAQFTDVYFINDNEGWVTVWHPFDTDDGTILHTGDGGTTWEVQTTSTSTRAIWMLDENTGYAGGHSGGFIFKTTNGGQNWNFHGLTGSPVMDITFPPGSETGYVCSDMNSYFHVINPEGVTSIFHGVPDFWTGISAVGVEQFYVCGGNDIEYYDGSFNQQATNTCGDIQDVWFVDANNGYAGNQCQIMGYVSPTIPWVVTGLTTSLTQGVFALNSNHVWVVGFQGLIMSTTNGSEFDRDPQGNATVDVVWETAVHSRMDVNFSNVFFTSMTNGYVVGAKNIIFKYTLVTATEPQLSLEPNLIIFPNPFVDQASVQLNIEGPINASLDLLDVSGKVLLNIFDASLAEGEHTFSFKTNGLAGGVYFLRLKTENGMTTRKILKLN